MWRAVLKQALADAELPKSERTGLEPAARIRARRYLRADSAQAEAYLQCVCEFAELPADRLIPWARRRYPASTDRGCSSPL